MKHLFRVAGTVVWRYAKEEKWINEMSAKGLHLTNISWFRYSFEEGTPGEYIYRMEVLSNFQKTAENTEYIQFIEGMEAEYVTCLRGLQNWVWFRKKAIDGAFDLFSDIDSRIKHLNRILGLLGVGCVVLLSAGILNVGLFLLYGLPNNAILNLLVGTASASFGFFLGFNFFKLLERLRKLKKERVLRE